MNWPAAERLLTSGLRELGVSADRRDPSFAFLRLLEKWNRTYNLTAVREPEAMVTHHVLDSLVVAPYLHGTRVIDVGTGAGLPGIPLAMARPELEFVLLDSNSKKTRFVTQAINELQLANVRVERARAEDFRPSRPFDTVVSRAFTSLAQMLRMTQHLCAPDGVFLALKGAYPTDELREVPGEFRVSRVESLRVPELHAERHIVVIDFSLSPGRG